MRYASITDRLADLGSEKWAIHLEARALAARGVEVIELTIGEPDIAPDRALLDECARAMHAGRTRYSNGRGETAVLDALASKYSTRTGRTIGRENLLCFPGTQTALYAAMMGLVESGDSVLVGDPFYATYDGVIRATGARRVSVPLQARHGFRMQAEDLEAAITPDSRVLLLNSPHNPTGAVLSRDEVAAIGEICQKHDLWLVSDEVYEDLIFDGSFVSPFDNAALAQRVVAVSSISKSHAAPGFRSGWAVGPAEFCDRLLPLSETMLFGGQPFIADMTAFALTQSSDTAARMRDAYRHRAQLVIDGVVQAFGVTPVAPEAGMFIVLDIGATGMDGDAFAWSLLKEERVATMPGSSFGDQASNLIRLSLTVPDDSLRDACRRIVRFSNNTATSTPLQEAKA